MIDQTSEDAPGESTEAPSKAVFAGLVVATLAAAVVLALGNLGLRPKPDESSDPINGLVESVQRSLDENRAAAAAKTLVLNSLLTPGTVQWVSLRTIDRKGDAFIVHVVADAQNEYGALVRRNYLAALNLGQGDAFTYNQLFALQDCADPPQDYEIQFVRNMNGWGLPESPSAAPPVAAGAGRPPQKTQAASVEGLLASGFRFPNRSDIVAKVAWLQSSSGDDNAWRTFEADFPEPYHARADFDGDGSGDDAWILLRTSQPGWGAFVFLRGRTIVQELTIDEPIPAQRVGLQVLPPGKFKGFDGKPAKLPGLYVFHFETEAGTVYSWDGGERQFKECFLEED